MTQVRDREHSLAAIGCMIVALPVVVVLSPIILAWTIWEDHQTRALRRHFARAPRTAGKLGILVYSNSPHWQRHIEDNWLPRLQDRLVVLNWSERARWDEEHPLEAKLFRRFAGRREFNPLAIIFADIHRHPTWLTWLRAIRRLDLPGILTPSVQPVRTIRFWQAFRDHKHGRSHSLRRLEEELFTATLQ